MKLHARLCWGARTQQRKPQTGNESGFLKYSITAGYRAGYRRPQPHETEPRDEPLGYPWLCLEKQTELPKGEDLSTRTLSNE